MFTKFIALLLLLYPVSITQGIPTDYSYKLVKKSTEVIIEKEVKDYSFVDKAFNDAGCLFISDSRWKKIYPNDWEGVKSYKVEKIFTWLSEYKSIIEKFEKTNNVPRYVAYAMLLHESNGGKSSISKFNNLTGIKCSKKSHQGKTSNHCMNVSDDKKTDVFLKFESIDSFFDYWYNTVLSKSWYKDCYSDNPTTDEAINVFAKGLVNEAPKYATDPNYERKISSLAFKLKEVYKDRL